MSNTEATTVAADPQTSYPKDKIRIVLLEGVHAAAGDRLEAEGFNVERLDGARAGTDLAGAIQGAHAIGIRSKSQIDAEALRHADKLLAVGCFCIGTNQVDLGASAAMGVPVFNSPFSNTRSVAELVIAEVIALHRRLLDRSTQMHAGQWRKSSAGSHEVRGRTLGIVGYGRIGSQVSVLAEAMGMRVIYHDIVPTLAMGNARAADSLEDLLRESDVVTLHVPATEGTDKLIGERELGMMRPGAMLLNNSRGSVVDIEALAAAVKKGDLAGAAVDVFPQEPASNDEPFESPLCRLDNVILTPHVGGSTGEAQEAIAHDVAGKLTRFINIGSTTGAVNVPQVELPEQPPGDRGRPHRILHFHKNVPGVLGKLHEVLSAHGANVSAEVLGTNRDLGYVVLDVDPGDSRPVVEELEAIPETIRVRVLW
ncbi:MAG: phosphoglycerate dehydrogenase [Phycisphaerales bacterium JB060]